MFKKLKYLFYLVFSVTSVVVLPAVQGTTPAFVICFAFLFSLPFLVRASGKVMRFYTIIGILMGIFVLLTMLAQFGIFIFEHPAAIKLPLVNNDPPLDLFLRSSIITQLLYLFAAIIAFALVAVFYEEKDLSTIFLGVRILVGYGFIEWTAYLLTGRSVDFLTNRTFDDSLVASLFQTIDIGGISLQRMKSLTGEPSMFSFTLLPFWVLAIEYKRRKDILLITAGLCLTLSTTAALGMVVYGMYKFFTTGIKVKAAILTLAVSVCALLFILFGDIVILLWEQLVVEKLSGQSVSGDERIGGLTAGISFWSDASLWTKLFGTGFGIVRSTDFFSTVLVNSGVVGLIVWGLLFFSPFLLFRGFGQTEKKKRIFPALLVIFTTMFLSVPEYMYLSIWIPLGIVYNSLITVDNRIPPPAQQNLT